MTHPHKDLIIALLDDPTLEVDMRYSVDDAWHECLFDSIRDAISFVVTRPDYQFRLREKPKPDVVRYEFVTAAFSHKEQSPGCNLRLTFTADGVLKNAEVLQ